MQVVSQRRPTEAEWEELSFAWKVCKHVRSNAIVISRDLATVGIGAGQMSRVDSVRLAIEKARAASRARCSPPTPTSRSPTGPSSRSRRARRRSSSPAARSATTTRSRPSTRRRGDGLHQPPPLPPLSRAPGGDPPSPYEALRLQPGRARRRLRACRRYDIGDLDGVVIGETPYEQAVEILQRSCRELGRPGLAPAGRPDAGIRDRHLARRGGRARPRRGVRRGAAADDDGPGRRPDRPADAGRDRGRRLCGRLTG